MTRSKAILLKLPVDLADRLDQAVKELGVVRVAYIRESLRRNLHFFEQQERWVLRQLRDRERPVLDWLKDQAYR